MFMDMAATGELEYRTETVALEPNTTLTLIFI